MVLKLSRTLLNHRYKDKTILILELNSKEISFFKIRFTFSFGFSDL